MQVLTSLILAAFVGYIGAWYVGAIEGNFALLLLLATVVTGVYWLAERVYFLPRRRKAAEAFASSTSQRREELERMGLRADGSDDLQSTQHKLLKEFFMPYLKIRNRVEGYGVSIIKAGAKLVGHDAGPVRAPLTDLKPAEMEELKALIDKLGPQ